MANRDLIKRGAILHSETFDFVDHGKFFVIMGVSHGEVAGFFFINSGIYGKSRFNIRGSNIFIISVLLLIA